MIVEPIPFEILNDPQYDPLQLLITAAVPSRYLVMSFQLGLNHQACLTSKRNYIGTW